MPLGLEIGAKEIIITKDEKGYGLHVNGQSPVTIRNVVKDGPAYKAGARIGDQIIKVNGEFVGDAAHDKVVRMIKDQKFVRLLVRPCSECPDSPCSSESSIPPAVPVRHRSNASSVSAAAAAAVAAVRVDDAASAAAGAAPPKLPTRSVSDGLLKQDTASAAGGGGGHSSKSANEIKRRSTTKALRQKRAQITISGHWTPSSSCDAETFEFKCVQSHGEEILRSMATEAYQDVLKAIQASVGGSGDIQQQSASAADNWSRVEKSFVRLRALLDRYCPRPAGYCPIESALDFASSVRLPPLPQSAVAALRASPVGGPSVGSSVSQTRIDLHFDPGMSTDAPCSPLSTPKSPMPSATDEDAIASGFVSADRRALRTNQGLRYAGRQRASQSEDDQGDDDEDDEEEEPEIEMSSFMSLDPNFNRETPDSQSMEKALATLKTYLSGYARMKQFKPAMLVFLHSMLARKEAKWYKPLNFVIFDWIADDWRRREFPPKQAKRAAYALYSTYLHRDAPLSLQSGVQTLDPELGLPRLELADSVRGLSELFTRQPTDAQVERIANRLRDLQDRLIPLGDILVRSIGQEVLAKRRDGFVSDILPAIDSLREDLSEDKQQLFMSKSKPIMQAHLQFLAGASFGGALEAGCLATVLDHVFQLRPADAAVSDWPAPILNCPRHGGGRRLSATFEKRGPHLLRLVELDRLQACSGCGRLLCGPGPQGYVCTVGDCEVASHPACIEKVKPINCSASKLSLLARSLSGSRESKEHRRKSSGSFKVSPANQKPPQPQLPAAGLENGSLTVQQQHQARRQSQQSVFQDAASNESADLTAAEADAAAAAAFGRQSRSPSLQPVSSASTLVNGDLPTVIAADASLATETSDQPKDEGSQLGGRSQPLTPSALVSLPSDVVSRHPDILSVQVDFHAYIVDMDLNGRLSELRKIYDKDFDRLKEYQLALHEIVYSSMSHLRALTILHQLFVQDWPLASREMLNQLGLHFVPDCISLYKSLVNCLRGGCSLEDFRNGPSALLEKFGERLLAWYGEEDHVFEFKRLSLSFGFAKTATKRKTSNINEDDIILKLISLRRENQDVNNFFNRAESHPVMNKRRFVDLYSVNMQQTMRMATLLDAALKKAKKVKSVCSFAAKDAETLELCLNVAKDISDYSNSIGVKLKELSRQLVLSKSFSNFWEKSMMDDSQIHRFKNQISHLHTCRLYQTKEVHMPGLENYRLRLFVFSEFLLVISESDEGRTIKYQLLKHLGPSMSVASQQQQQQPQASPQQQQQQQTQSQSQQAPQTPAANSDAAPGHASLIAVSCPPIIPMESIIHIFDTDTENRRKVDLISGGSSGRVRCAEFRIIIEQTLDNSGRVKPLMLEFRVSQDKPKLPFLASETSSTASEFAECIRKLAPRLSSRLDRHSSMAGSSNDLAAGRPAAGPALSATSAAAATAAVNNSAAAAAAERHRRANSHAGLAVARPPLPEQQQEEEEAAAAELEQETSASATSAPSGRTGGIETATDTASLNSISNESEDTEAPGLLSVPVPQRQQQQQQQHLMKQELNRQRKWLRQQGHHLMSQLAASDLDSPSEQHQPLLHSNQVTRIVAAWRLVEDAYSAIADTLPRLLAEGAAEQSAGAVDDADVLDDNERDEAEFAHVGDDDKNDHDGKQLRRIKLQHQHQQHQQQRRQELADSMLAAVAAAARAALESIEESSGLSAPAATSAASAGSLSPYKPAASLPPPTPVDINSLELSDDTAALKRALNAANAKAAAAAAAPLSAHGSRANSDSRAETSSDNDDDLSASLTSGSGSAAGADIACQTPPPDDRVVVERRAQITRPGHGGGSQAGEEDDDDDTEEGSGSRSSSDKDSEAAS